MSELEQLMTPEDVAERLGITRKEVMRLEVSYYALGKRLRRYSPKDIEEYAKSRPRPLPELPSKEEILQRVVARPMEPAVYFLILKGEIVYVGQTINLLARLGKHADRRLEFDAYAVVHCKREDLARIESSYIFQFQPRYNRVGIYTRQVEEE